MSFQSILYRQLEPGMQTEWAEAPKFFGDLFLDQVVAAVTAGREQYNLKPFFHRPLDDVDDIAYRQDVMKDLEAPQLAERIAAFAEKFEKMRGYRRGSEEAYYRPAKQGWFLEAVVVYCGAVQELLYDLGAADLQSRGLLDFQEYLSRYVGSPSFRALAGDTERVTGELRAVRYCVQIRGLAVTVQQYADEANYSDEIDRTFAKFRHGSVKDYRVKFPEFTGIGHVEARILELIAQLDPRIFAYFEEYCRKYQRFIDPALQRFDREVQFYTAYLRYIAPLRQVGLPFCYPNVAATKSVHGDQVFDLALAAKVGEGGAVVPNDFYLHGKERVLVVSGPNQGGKTTFARTFGQLHYLASLGCPVPGTTAQLFLCDRLFAHFERMEDATNLRGKLLDDLLRIHRILDKATPNSLVILNEIFSSTALEDAVFLATRIMEMILARGCLCVCVTFLEEIAALDDAIVSMVSTVAPHDPALRTLKIVRRPADGRAYAIAIAEKWRLTYRSLKERLAS